MLIRARTVYPVSGAPIENGAIWIDGQRIQDVGAFSDLTQRAGSPVIDLGECIVLPGLVNAHCHLDYTGFARQIPPPSSFTAWVQQLIALKASWSYTDFAESWLKGVQQLIHSGTTTVGDIEAVPELLTEVLAPCPIRIVSFREIITIRNRKPVREIVSNAIQELGQVHTDFHKVGLAPHAPYTTSQELARLCAEAARTHGWRWTMHVGESQEEQAFFEQRSGLLFQWLKSQRDMADTGTMSPVAWLLETGVVGPELLIAHLNFVSDSEIQQLSSSGAQVVHCPRSHDYFQHPPFPFARLRKAGVRVSLGTDSLASVYAARGVTPTLDMFSEMRMFGKAHPEMPSEHILEMATRGGAAALGLAQETGVISPNYSADLIVLPASVPSSEASDAILNHIGPVLGSMVRGQWILPPPHT